MSRFWNILFCLVPILSIVKFVLAMFDVVSFGLARILKSFTGAGVTLDHLANGIHLPIKPGLSRSWS